LIELLRPYCADVLDIEHLDLVHRDNNNRVASSSESASTSASVTGTSSTTSTVLQVVTPEMLNRDNNVSNNSIISTNTSTHVPDCELLGTSTTNVHKRVACHLSSSTTGYIPSSKQQRLTGNVRNTNCSSSEDDDDSDHIATSSTSLTPLLQVGSTSISTSTCTGTTTTTTTTTTSTSTVVTNAITVMVMQKLKNALILKRCIAEFPRSGLTEKELKNKIRYLKSTVDIE
jgi:hypothetical protein